MDDDVKRLLDAMRQESAAAHVETRRHFDVVGEDLRREIGIVAEGVGANTERIERLSLDMKEEFADVRSMIKFSHAELDRRVRSLEQSQSALEES